MRPWDSLFVIQHTTPTQILDSISLGVIVPVRLFGSFSPSLHYLFCFSWNETPTKLACHRNGSAAESLARSMALSGQLARSLAQLCLLKNRVMSYILLIMEKRT